MFFLGNASGHDFSFHLASWMDVAAQWRHGILYPRWAEWANWGYGEPRFIFYPPLSWILGAALGSLLPWIAAPILYIWLVLAAAGMAMWRLAREWLGPAAAIAAALFYAANPYHLIVVYYRSDFAELLACALYPLLALEAISLARDGWRRAPLLALIFAGVWLSNAPAGVMATYALVLLLITGALLRRSARPLRDGAGAMALGFSLAAFYVLPAAWEQRWVQIGGVIASNLDATRNFIFAHPPDPQFLLFNLKVSAVAVGMILIAAIAAVFFLRQRAAYRWTIPLAALALAAALALLPVSAPAWRWLPELRFVQFPWRWLGILAVPFAIFAAGAGAGSRKRWIAWAAVFLVIAGTGAAIARDAWWDNDDVLDLAEAIRSGHGYAGMDEYSPLGCAPGQAAPDATGCIPEPAGEPPRVAAFDAAAQDVVPIAPARIRIERWTAERKIFTESSPSGLTLTPRVLDYPAWQARMDGRIAPMQSADETAQLLLPVPAGAHRIELRFRRTWDRTVGGAISLAALLLLLFAWRRQATAPEPPQNVG